MGKGLHKSLPKGKRIVEANGITIISAVMEEKSTDQDDML